MNINPHAANFYELLWVLLLRYRGMAINLEDRAWHRKTKGSLSSAMSHAAGEAHEEMPRSRPLQNFVLRLYSIHKDRSPIKLPRCIIL